MRQMGLEEKLRSGILLTMVEKVAGYARKSSVWPATFSLTAKTGRHEPAPAAAQPKHSAGSHRDRD